MEGPNGLQSPGLASLTLRLCPGDGLPVRREDQARAGMGHLHAVAPGFIHVEEECLLHGVLVRPGFDEHARFEEGVRRLQDRLAAASGASPSSASR